MLMQILEADVCKIRLAQALIEFYIYVAYLIDL